MENRSTHEWHIKRHIELHKAFDELLADWLDHNRQSETIYPTIQELMKWSHEQTINPTEKS